jgi:cardiolipin synthase
MQEPLTRISPISTHRRPTAPLSIRGRFTAAALILLLAGCAHVLPRIALPVVPMEAPSFRATLVAYAGAPIVPGNRVDVLLNGDQVFPATIAAIRAAQKSINYAQYVFEDGAPAVAITQALAERCRAGIAVHVLLDAIGALAMPTQYRDWMTSAGCQVATFRPLRPWAIDRVNNRNHRRILVVDGVVGFTGGAGTSGKWSGNGKESGFWRDTEIRVEGPVVAHLQGAFVENWLEATGVALGGPLYFPHPIEIKGSVDAQVVRSSPAGGGMAMYTMFLLAMASARRSIYITNPYFLPDAEMLDTLLQARRRGVRVVLLLPHAIDHNLVRLAGRRELGRLLEGGVEIAEYEPAMLHAKTMVIDSIWSTVGSTNLDRRSFALNDELNVVMYDAAVAGRLEEIFKSDMARARPVTYEQWSHRGLLSQLLEILAVPLRSQL